MRLNRWGQTEARAQVENDQVKYVHLHKRNKNPTSGKKLFPCKGHHSEASGIGLRKSNNKFL
jgi:hypothetical protein